MAADAPPTLLENITAVATAVAAVIGAWIAVAGLIKKLRSDRKVKFLATMDKFGSVHISAENHTNKKIVANKFELVEDTSISSYWVRVLTNIARFQSLRLIPWIKEFKEPHSMEVSKPSSMYGQIDLPEAKVNALHGRKFQRPMVRVELGRQIVLVNLTSEPNDRCIRRPIDDVRK